MSEPSDWKRDALESEARTAHDAVHDDPLDFWGECSMCAEKIEGEIDEGIRCTHGAYIPDLPNGMTDIPCPKCEHVPH